MIKNFDQGNNNINKKRFFGKMKNIIMFHAMI